MSQRILKSYDSLEKNTADEWAGLFNTFYLTLGLGGSPPPKQADEYWKRLSGYPCTILMDMLDSLACEPHKYCPSLGVMIERCNMLRQKYLTDYEFQQAAKEREAQKIVSPVSAIWRRCFARGLAIITGSQSTTDDTRQVRIAELETTLEKIRFGDGTDEEKNGRLVEYIRDISDRYGVRLPSCWPDPEPERQVRNRFRSDAFVPIKKVIDNIRGVR